ncbi:MAG: outer membrane beta-barrel domain-containing protein [Myxococcota bacterium]
MRVFGGITLLLAALCLALPASVGAQMEFSLDEVDDEKPNKPAEKTVEKDAAQEGDLIEQLAAEQAVEGPDEPLPEREETVEEIFAVQQIYALRLKRLELAPSAAFTVNDPYLRHPGLGMAVNYWFTNVLSVGLNFIWYDWGNPLERGTTLVEQIQRSFRLGVPINEWQFGLWANFTYVPFYGKFSMFRKFLFQWDAYLIGGVGLMRTRPIPVFDPEIREFDWNARVSFNVGIGLRIFLTRYLTFFTEFRDYMFLEQFENVNVSPSNRDDPSTWLADSSTFFNNLTVQFGFTVFFPIKFEYRLPK